MLNSKKLSMSYKKYRKNFVNESFIEHGKTEYERCISKIVDIVESNNVDRDHVLLINLGTIYDNYLMTWKEEVLVQNTNRIEGLKLMYPTVFYQCISQELYRIRYPNSTVDYTFKEIISTLIHFTMFGWQKEERILFDFIAAYISDRFISSNDWNKHTWFLLELYLQYRNKTLLGASRNVYTFVKKELESKDLRNDLLPDDLGIYDKVLKCWSTPIEEEITALIGQMINYHSELASELGKSIEFGDYRYGFYPYEILFLIHVRKKSGLPVPQHFEDILMNTPEAKMVFKDPEPYPEKDPLLVQIDSFYRKNYPDYFLNQYGEELFQ
ncbi:hypothetical protein MKZ07_10455 [Paenibacillus sp. FSL P4-0338]|uniref:hypothetical protein n=1 Tax=unclassified Paenibacillus TaxID=185978 RepID=UPI0003E21924|nr:hypothetical protein [Paenibacillus sp. FSL R7-269]ETT34061.1 hypothetical protein C162_30060 [Paenibacillus sp. FSL R7-269]